VTTRDSALAEIVEIARQHSISGQEIARELGGASREEADDSGRSMVRQLLAYVGGIFVFAGILVYIAMFWAEMNSAARIIITLGSGLVALILAMLMLGYDKFAKAATPLFLTAAWLQPTGIMVAFEELGSGGNPQHAVLATTTVMLLQSVLILLRHPRSVLVFIALGFAALTCLNVFDLLGVDEDINTLITGLSLMLVTFGIDQTSHRSITPFWYFLGSALFLWAAFELLEDTPANILYLGICAFMIYVSTLARSRTVLFTSTLAMMGYLGYFTSEYFANSVGWPVALIVMGLILIGLSNLALRINRKYIANS
jgi:hypothetical protein